MYYVQVDKVKGGIRLGFVQINEGKVENLVHIECLIFPAVFRALQNGHLKNETPPGEPMIMQSLLQALKKSIDLSRIQKIIEVRDLGDNGCILIICDVCPFNNNNFSSV